MGKTLSGTLETFSCESDLHVQVLTQIRENLPQAMLNPRATTNAFTLENGVSPCRKIHKSPFWM
jgi:hypothetical protein